MRKSQSVQVDGKPADGEQWSPSLNSFGWHGVLTARFCPDEKGWSIRAFLSRGSMPRRRSGLSISFLEYQVGHHTNLIFFWRGHFVFVTIRGMPCVAERIGVVSTRLQNPHLKSLIFWHVKSQGARSAHPNSLRVRSEHLDLRRSHSQGWGPPSGCFGSSTSDLFDPRTSLCLGPIVLAGLS